MSGTLLHEQAASPVYGANTGCFKGCVWVNCPQCSLNSENSVLVKRVRRWLWPRKKLGQAWVLDCAARQGLVLLLEHWGFGNPAKTFLGVLLADCLQVAPAASIDICSIALVCHLPVNSIQSSRLTQESHTIRGRKPCNQTIQTLVKCAAWLAIVLQPWSLPLSVC